jgi:hypothetical protein
VFRFQIAVAAVLFAGLSTSGAKAEEAGTDTMAQHHQWSQKFGPASDPEVTGSIAAPANTRTDSPKECVPTGMGFSTPPIARWRIGAC